MADASGRWATASPHTEDAGPAPYVFKEEPKKSKKQRRHEKKLKKQEKWLLKTRSMR